MIHLFKCRRTFIAFAGMILLGCLAFFKDIDTSIAIASIAVGLAGSNAYEKRISTSPKYRSNE